MKKSLRELTDHLGNVVYNDKEDNTLIVMNEEKTKGVLFEREADDSEYPNVPWENWFEIINGEVIAQFDMVKEEKQYIIDYIK